MVWHSELWVDECTHPDCPYCHPKTKESVKADAEMK